LPGEYNIDNLNDFSSLGEVGWNLEQDWHTSYHRGVRVLGCGDIGTFIHTPRDPAFWMAHKKLDEVARDWQSLQATDVVLVIDRSGSMASTINDAREAARTFADLVLDVRLTTAVSPVPAAEQHRIGLVSFAFDATNDMDPLGLTSADGIVTENGVDTSFETALAGISTSGATSIAAGIREAISILSSVSDPNPHQAILVLTDGKENWAPCLGGNSPSECSSTDVLTVGEVGDIQIVAIGFGDGAEEANLRDVAERHGGVFFAAPDISDALTLQKFFVTAFSEIFDAATAGAASTGSPKSLLGSASDRTMQSGQQASEPFKIEIASGDERLTVVLGFEEIRRDSLDRTSKCDLELELFTPSGKRVNRSDKGIEASQGPRYDFITANLPYQGESTGTWTGLVGRAPGSEKDCGAQDYFYSVLVKGLGRIDPFVVRPNLVVGRPILATFRISESNRPVGGFDRVDAEVTLTRPDGRTETHPLFDDGTNGDRLAGNHIWSVEIPGPVKDPGPYHLRAHFELTHKEGTRARVSEYSIVAQPQPEHCTNVVASGVVNAYMQHRPQPGDIIQLDELVCLYDKCGAPDRYEMQITDSMGWLRTPDPQGTGTLVNLPRSFRSGSVKGFGVHCLGSPDPDDSDGGIPLVAVIPESAKPGDRSVVSIRVRSLTHPDQEPVDVETAIEVFPPPDCNQNGVDDAIDIANGTSKDQDHNGIPDACEGGEHYAPAAAASDSQRLLVGVLRGGQVFGTPAEFRVNSLVTFLVYRYQEDDLSDTTQITDFALSLPANLGTVSGSRVRLNTVAGVTGAVRVTAGGLSTNYRITTMPSSIDHLEIRPADVRIASGTTIDFNARGVDRFGNIFTLSGVNVGWHVVPPELGTIQSRTGVLSATTPGVSGYVIAVVSGSLRFGAAASGEGVSKVTVLGQIPQSFALLPNYPNPFNPETTIRFDLPTTALVDVSAYNLAGQRVETLLRDQMPAGSHSVVWFAGEHPSGVYIIRLEAGELSETQKVLLAK
jgi:hypothetical protein